MIQKLSTVVRRSTSAFIFLFKYILTKNWLGNLIYSLTLDIRYDTDFRGLQTDFFRTAYADPEQIKYKINPSVSFLSYPFTQMGRIETGDFPSGYVLCENYYIYTSLYDHFVNGSDWSETAYYTMAFDHLNLDELGWSQVSSQDELDDFFKELDMLYQNIQSEGYLESAILKPRNNSTVLSTLIRPLLTHDEVFIDIGASGELLLVDGRHRLAIARILSIDEIPVRIISRHKNWCQLRNGMLRFIQKNSGMSKYEIQHPEFSHVEYRYDAKAIAEEIATNLESKNRTIAEYAPGPSGKLLQELENYGYETYALARSPEEQRFLEWYTEYFDVSSIVTSGSSFDMNALQDSVLLVFESVDYNHVIEILNQAQNCVLVTTEPTLYRGNVDDTVQIIAIDEKYIKQ